MHGKTARGPWQSNGHLVQQLRQQDCNEIEVKDMETEGDGDTASSHTSEGEIENNDETLRKSRVKVRFTQEEDNYLRKGIVKFGMRWTAILNCPLYKFEQSRAPTTLRMRATTLKLI